MVPSDGRSGGGLSREEVGALYARTGHLVVRRCWLVLGDAAEAEDMMQETFRRVMEYGRNLGGAPVPLRFLYRTAERCCFERLRRRKREPVGDEADLAGFVSASCDAEQREAGERVMGFFRSLGPEEMQLALLLFVDGRTQQEAAGVLECSRRTVGKKLARLRKRAARLAKEHGGAP